MTELTIENLFEEQLEGSEQLTDKSPQVKNKRIDYLGNTFEAGDRVLYAVINRYDDNEVELVTIAASAADNLLDETKFQFDNKDIGIPRFYQIDKCKTVLQA